jgi:hypothetical protein
VALMGPLPSVPGALGATGPVHGMTGSSSASKKEAAGLYQAPCRSALRSEPLEPEFRLAALHTALTSDL